MSWPSVTSFFPENWTTAIVVFAVTLLVLAIRSSLKRVEDPVDLCDLARHCGDITLQELSKYDGRDPFRPIYLSVKGHVFDVTSGRDFYGPGELY